MDYKIIRSKRRTLCVQVIGSEVIVRSPFLLPKMFIDRFVEEKQSWINKTLSKTQISKELNPNEIYYLGTVRTLCFGEEEKIEQNSITLRSIGSTNLERKKALEKFLKQETSAIVKDLIDKYPQFTCGKLKFSYYLSKWGSCSPEDDLTFNIKLAMCPLQVIEYVVIHELCHIRVKNHSSRFWSEVESLMKDYKINRKWLRDHRWYI